MEKQSVDRLFRSELAGGHSIPPEELWVVLEQKLTVNHKSRDHKIWWISIPVASAFLLMFNMYLTMKKPKVNQPVFSQVNQIVLIQETEMELVAATPSLYHVNKNMVEIEYNPMIPFVETVDDPQIENAIVQARALSLLNEVELELSAQESIKILRINPEFLLEEVDQESKGNKFAKTMLSKIKGGFKEIESIVVSRKEK